MAADADDANTELEAVDLFSGCGGLSLGFSWAGFCIRASVELDEAAATTHHANFQGPAETGRNYGRDILQLAPEELLADELRGKSPAVLMGGPPCQAFARIGRAKLREVADTDRAHLEDPRATLSLRYLDYVRTLKPKALLIENVPDILNHGGRNVAEVLCRELSTEYESRYTILNAVNYGVPQYRERMFLIAYRRDANLPIPAAGDWWPTPTHKANLPSGYRGTRAVASKIAGSCPHFDPPTTVAHRGKLATELLPAVSVEKAFSGLPILNAELHGRGRRDLRPSQHDKEHLTVTSDYATLMQTRGTPRVDGPATQVTAHVTRHLPRDFDIFRLMKEGQDYVGNINGKSCPSVPELAKSIGREVPYDDTKFPNKWWKMRSRHPSRTLTAHIGKDTYSHIHHSQARTISVREAARLQSFPDTFRFECSMNAGFRMIGNAVPPLMAEALARKMLQVLEATDETRHQTSSTAPQREATTSA